MIISASRRTDIPAFYADWFVKRVREGHLMTRNPFNYNQVRRVSLLPQDVDVIVFWTRNPSKLVPYLDELDDRGFRYYFQYTLTGYPRLLERNTPNPYQAIESFQKLSQRLGNNRVIWRYDPILISNLIPLEEHVRLFEKIADALTGYTERVIISFADFYAKTEKNLKKIEELSCDDANTDPAQYLALSHQLSEIAQNHKMDISSCAEDIDLNDAGIRHGKCIDNAFIRSTFDLALSGKKDSGQRKACGCIKSVDIGMYNSCLHGCQYCYATFNEKQVHNNYAKHDPDSPFLIGT